MLFPRFALRCQKRFLSLSKKTQHERLVERLSKFRNIGVLAHIDAGKTTTTERMLYFSGEISSMGEVHDGNTTTDFLAQERQRGITISSAFVTFKWDSHTINLVDTPGHIDFTSEVENSLGVMDSAVVILDGVSGVEAQTLTVWRQSDSHDLPRIVYVNKLDRPGAELSLSLNSLKEKFKITTLPLTLPMKGAKSLEGIIDVLNLELLTWSKNGNQITKTKLAEGHAMYNLAKDAKYQLFDNLSSVDNILAERVIQEGSFDDIPIPEYQKAIRRATLSRTAVPVICGSSYKNIGVQTLIDAIVSYLPSPLDSKVSSATNAFDNGFAARCFKVMHDKQRGPLCFLRIYSGELSKNTKVYNPTLQSYEQVGKVYMVFADDFEDVGSASCGDFVAVSGLKKTNAGDLLCSSGTSVQNATKKAQTLDVSNDFNLFLNTFGSLPDPVFFCSIEPPSQAYQQPLEKALQELQREDPSLRVTYETESGQTVLAGMGELHLEIIKDRIKTNYKIDADLGPLQIVYKETLSERVKETVTLHHTVGSSEQHVTITLSLIPGQKAELINFDNSAESAANLAHIQPRFLSAIKRGVDSAFNSGPLLYSKVVNVYCLLHWFEVGRGTSETSVSAAAQQCAVKALKSGGGILLEPFMKLTISVEDKYVSSILSDLSHRRSNIISINQLDSSKEILCETPLAELLGYSKYLRTVTSGTASLSMEISNYFEMSSTDMNEVLQKTRY